MAKLKLIKMDSTQNWLVRLVFLVLVAGTVLLPWFGLPAASRVLAAGSQSVQGATVALPNTAPWTTAGDSSKSYRMEFRWRGWNGATGYLLTLGGMGLWTNNPTSLFYNGADHIAGGGPFFTNVPSNSDLLMRIQRNAATGAVSMEYCVVATNVCASQTMPIDTWGSQNWGGLNFNMPTGNAGSISFLRWYSTLVPVGTPISINGTAGDIADWEFQGNGNDSGPYGLTMTGGSYTQVSSQLPQCNAGAQQVTRTSSALTLDGSASNPLDGGSTLAYSWSQLSGPTTVNWLTANTVVRPQVSGFAFGSYVFQLSVTDSSGQTSTCTVKDGAVVADANGVVTTNNPAVDNLLGPLVMYGANPWPWFDNRQKQSADNLIATMDTYFPAWWDNAAPGTISVTNGSNIITGVGTTFTTTFCQGPSNPTAPQSGYPVIAVWHPLGSGTGRVMFSVTSCTDDTHLTVDRTYGQDAPASTFPSASGLTYAADNQYATVWGWSQKASPANYYDNVAAYYSLYYRTGLDDYLTAARKLADRFWESPMVDQGVWPPGYGYTGRSISAMGLVLRALDGRSDMWTGPSGATGAGLHNIWDQEMQYLNVFDPEWGLSDTREEAYTLAMASYCGLYDPDPGYQSKCDTAIINSFPTVWTPDKAPDGSWPQLYNSASSWTPTVTTVNLQNGSAAVTGVGTSWNAGEFPSGTRIWFMNSSAQPLNNASGDSVSYVATYVDATHLTLDRPYQGTTGSHGWEISGYNALGWVTQPYMEGILSSAFDLASKALANTNPTTAALARSYNLAATNWIKNTAYWSDDKGLYYFVGGPDCTPPIADSNALCTGGDTPDAARALWSDALRGLDAAYAYNHDPSISSFIDTIYNAMWAKPGTCPAGSSVCVPDGTYISPMDDGQYMIAAPPSLSALGSGTPWKWFGYFFGFSAQASWPALRTEFAGAGVVSPPAVPAGGGGGGGSGVTPPIQPPLSTPSSGSISTGPANPNSGTGSAVAVPSQRLINLSGTYYLITNGVRHGITSPGILNSYGYALSNASLATAEDSSLPLGSLLLPGDGALVKSAQDKTVYLISNQTRYAFTSASVFEALGFKFSSVLLVTNPELQALPQAPQLLNDGQAHHLPGLDINENGTIYWIGGDDQLHAYPDLSTYNSWHIKNDFSRVVPANAQDLTFPVGSPTTPRNSD